MVKDLFTNEGALIKYWQQNVFNDLFFCCLICVLMQFKEIINFASYYYCYYLKKSCQQRCAEHQITAQLSAVDGTLQQCGLQLGYPQFFGKFKLNGFNFLNVLNTIK